MAAEALGTEPQLLVDDHLLASKRGVVRTLHPATKVRRPWLHHPRGLEMKAIPPPPRPALGCRPLVLSSASVSPPRRPAARRAGAGARPALGGGARVHLRFRPLG
eukprot:SAG22_NODE_496_length_9797_cov_4.177241_2_plen_105_part_00